MWKRSVLISVAVLACVSTVQAVEMVWAPVGDPGNLDDTLGDGYGGVADTYNIGKYEVTNAQYAEFLNAVAESDPNGLYNLAMGNGYGGIARNGGPGGHSYATIPGRANMPVNYVSWYDTLRFANWMHNGQPTGAQDDATTEDGAYDMSLGLSVVRKPDALVFLTSEDEWYKAAYYKGGGTNAGYWYCPAQSDTPPDHEEPPGTNTTNGSANYHDAVEDLTPVGSYVFKPSDSSYGTFDQGGNVYEWNETVVDGSYACNRGGQFATIPGATPTPLCAEFRDVDELPTLEHAGIGFRVAGVSEPVPTVSEWGMLALMLCVMVAGTVVFRRRALA